MKNTKLVYSSDPKENQACPKCKELLKECTCPKEVRINPNAKFVAVFRLETGGRGGKTVTVIDQLPKNEILLKDLTKEIKNKCGTGGTYLMDGKDGIIEIQGDKRVQIKAMFDKKGIKYKGM